MTTANTVEEIVEALRHCMGVSALSRLVLDSRRCQPGDVFVACSGLVGDGRNHLDDAIAKGVAAVVYESDLTPSQSSQLGSTPALSVADLPTLLGRLAHVWWGKASDGLTVVAITGTNGKTTTANWLAAALNQLGRPCGVIGTLGVLDPHGVAQPGQLTTPDILSMHECLASLKNAGATHVVLEASSIGLDQNRLDAVSIDIAVFTNLSQDHLDYHADMAAYAQAKASLFAMKGLTAAVINTDDPWAEEMTAAASRALVCTYGLSPKETGVSACQIEIEPEGMRFDLVVGSKTAVVRTPFVGEYNVSNMLAVATTLTHLNIAPSDIVTCLEKLPAVAGRLESVVAIESVGSATDRLPRVLVDYAHTPDALQRVLEVLKPMAKARHGRLWCVVGCGGNRDASKRPLMAQAAFARADHVVFTSDNPRGESPDHILQDMLAGLANDPPVHVQSDRAIAILTTIWQAQPNDVVLLAGKGHETWQEVGAARDPFDDRQWARLALLFKEQAPLVQTDSRHLIAGSLFVALRGEKFDGHDFLPNAEQSGVVAALVAQPVADVSVPQICLGDTLLALQKFACAWRQRFDIPVIGVTGSNGKTTTKEMIASILRQWVGGDATLSTQGNLNNEIGVPLTVLRLRQSHRCAVIELGMNHPGEIARLTEIAQPSIGLVLNAQREHQEFMQSVQAVAHENGQVLAGLPRDGVAIFPSNDPYAESWIEQSQTAAAPLTFGLSATAGVQALEVSTDALGSQFVLSINGQSQAVSLSVAGLHNVSNACAAAACASAAGVPMADIAQGLEVFAAVRGRMQVHRLGDERLLIDDSYNANPDSVRAAIDVLSGLPAPRALVLGDMGEVGENGVQMHAEVGAYAREQAIQYLWTMGQATVHSVDAFGPNGQSFASVEQLCERARAIEPMSVLVKGSRFMAMEKVVQQLQKSMPQGRAVEDHHAR